MNTHGVAKSSDNASHATRRAILAGAAALPALAIIPATVGDAAGVDPIFAAIERQKQLWTKWTSITEPKELRSAAYAAWDKWNQAAQTAYNDGMDDLLATKPTTRAGATALITHCLAEESDLFCRKNEPTYALLRTLAKAMPALT